MKSVSYQIYHVGDGKVNNPLLKNPKEISTITARPQVTKVEIIARIYTNQTLQYLMRKYLNLTSLTMNTTSNTSIYQEFNDEGSRSAYDYLESELMPETLVEFFMYLDKI